MVKALFLGLLAATMCGLVSSAPQIAREDMASSPEEEDPAARNQRSVNLSRKIQMFVKNRHLQILPDGTVNGTTDDKSAYTVLQRTSVGIGLMKIQGVATCQYLCMDSCGLLYGSREFSDECVFNETIEQHNYNTYSSKKYSDDRRTLYLALNRRGQPRKVLLRATQQLGRLSSYTRVLTHPATVEPTEELHPLRHRGHLCSTAPNEQSPRLANPIGDPPSEHPRCRKRKRRKKKRRKCDSEPCGKPPTVVTNARKLNKLKCEHEDGNECQRIEVTMKKKHKAKLSDTQVLSGVKKNKNKKHIKKRPRVSVISTESALEEASVEEDYPVDSNTTTAWDWEDTTVLPGTPDDFSTTHPPD